MDVGAHLAATEHQNKGLIAMIVPPFRGMLPHFG